MLVTMATITAAITTYYVPALMPLQVVTPHLVLTMTSHGGGDSDHFRGSE